MPSVQAVGRRPSKFPDFNGMKTIRCANQECKSFLGYEAIKVGIIQIKCHHKGCKQVTQVTAGPVSDTAPPNLLQVRCPDCGRFLYGEAIAEGKVRVKCRSCGQWNTLDIIP